MYRSPPILVGYNYTSKQAYQARDRGGLLAMRLETSLACNLKCVYCNGRTGKSLPGELSLRQMKNAISQVRALGGKSVVIIGGGEPTIYPHFRALVSFVRQKKMIPVIFTNGLKLTAELTQFLYDQNASVLFKLDSLDENIQDSLSGRKGTSRNIARAVKNLFKVGYNRGGSSELRCGASFVVTNLNYNEIPRLWKFCRDNNLYPNLEELIPRNRGSENNKILAPKRAAIKRLKEKLLALDRATFGFDWLVYAPLPGHGCLQTLYSVYVTSKGYLRPCADIEVETYNVKENRIKEVIASDFFERARYPERHLTGKCGACEHLALCVGCRGLAFCRALERGINSFDAICAEDPLCWKK